jgi:MFS family permease
MIGSGTGGKIIQMSRRIALYIVCIVGSIGCGLTLKFGLFYLITGRVIYGYVSGVSGVAATSFIADYVPVHLYGSISPIFNLSLCIGVMFAMCSAAVLPPDTHTEELMMTTNWRYIYMFPIFIYAIAVLLLTLVIKNDGPRFYI